MTFIGKDSDAGRDWGQEEKGTTDSAGHMVCAQQLLTVHSPLSLLLQKHQDPDRLLAPVTMALWLQKLFGTLSSLQECPP